MCKTILGHDRLGVPIYDLKIGEAPHEPCAFPDWLCKDECAKCDAWREENGDDCLPCPSCDTGIIWLEGVEMECFECTYLE